MTGWTALAVLGVGVGAFWILGPGEVETGRDMALRGLHGGTWLFLGAAAACKGAVLGAPTRWAGRFGAAAALSYAGFIGILVLT